MEQEIERTGVLAETIKFIQALGFDPDAVTTIHVDAGKVTVSVIEKDVLGNVITHGNQPSVRTYWLANEFDPLPEEAEEEEEEQEDE